MQRPCRGCTPWPCQCFIVSALCLNSRYIGSSREKQWLGVGNTFSRPTLHWFTGSPQTEVYLEFICEIAVSWNSFKSSQRLSWSCKPINVRVSLMSRDLVEVANHDSCYGFIVKALHLNWRYVASAREKQWLGKLFKLMLHIDVCHVAAIAWIQSSLSSCWWIHQQLCSLVACNVVVVLIILSYPATAHFDCICFGEGAMYITSFSLLLYP